MLVSKLHQHHYCSRKGKYVVLLYYIQLSKNITTETGLSLFSVLVFVRCLAIKFKCTQCKVR